MNHTRQILLPALTAVALTIAAAVSLARGSEVTAGDVAVTAAWARATPPAATTGAAYLTIENRGSADDHLVSASSPAAGMVMIHETIEEAGIARMRPVENPTISAGGTLEMEPGGTHLMLMDLKQPLTEGNHVPLTLVFERAGAVTVDAVIGPIGSAAPPDSGM
jgi:copper(I)-binding protein